MEYRVYKRISEDGFNLVWELIQYGPSFEEALSAFKRMTRDGYEARLEYKEV